jgi:hypothetical protein
VCGSQPPDVKMHFDHNHANGQNREALCRHCNLMLGFAQDRPDRLRAGANYLERHGAQ